MSKCFHCGGVGLRMPVPPDCLIADLKAGEIIVEACDRCYAYRDDLAAALSLRESARQVGCANGGFHALAPIYGLNADDRLASWIDLMYHSTYGRGWRPWIEAQLSDVSELVIYTSIPHDPVHIDALAGYYMRGRGGLTDADFAMTGVELVEGDRAQLFFYACDLTKFRSDDAIARVDTEFFDLLSFGTPVRKTDSHGPKGTRAVEGIVGAYFTAWR